MKTNLFLLLLCTLSIFFSCRNDTPDIKGNYFLVFYPRHCECITTKILSHKERPQNWYAYHPQQELQAQDADLCVGTGTNLSNNLIMTIARKPATLPEANSTQEPVT